MEFFLDYCSKVKLSIHILVFLICTSSPLGMALDFFEPQIIEGNNEPLCELALSHYRVAFRSDEITVKELISEEITPPAFTVMPLENDAGILQLADVVIDGQQLVLAYHKRAHSWRGDIYSDYLVPAEKKVELIRQLDHGGDGAIKPFYPAGGGFAWRQEIPFEFQGRWFMAESGSGFDENDGLRNVFSINSEGASRKICTIKVFESFDSSNKITSSHLPFFSAYVKSMEKVMVSSGHCGTSNPEVPAKNRGRLFVSLAVIRPWALKFDQGRFDPPKKLLQEHFDQWRYSDIWSYREKDVLESLRLDAQAELSKYLQVGFSYTADNANQLATLILHEMNISYYSLASFEKAGVDFSKYRQLVDGSLSDWQHFSKEISVDEEKILFPEFSLIVDNPSFIERLPQRNKAEKFMTMYEKDLLMVAAHMNNYDSVKYLVENSWPLDRVTVKEDDFCWEGPARVNRSALTYAVENSSPYLINYLIRAGANTEIVDSEKNNLNFYLQMNPWFSDEEKSLGLSSALKKYGDEVKIKPTYPCDGKLNRLEAAVCNSEGLSIYDRQLNSTYKKAISITSISDQVKKSQIKWIGDRVKLCGKFAADQQLNACVARMTRARIRYLESLTGSF